MNPVMEMAVSGQITFYLSDNGFDILELDQSRLDRILQAIAEDKLLNERFQTIVIGLAKQLIPIAECDGQYLGVKRYLRDS